MTDQSITAAVLALLTLHGGAWSGTTADLNALLPGIAPDATRLGKLLTDAADDLAAAGITIERRRQPRTGARIMTLTRRADPLPATTPEVTLRAAAVTLRVASTSKAGSPLPERPLFACPACGSRQWWWRSTLRRSASRWCCVPCVAPISQPEAKTV